MTANEFEKLCNLDASLAVGQEHWFRFTNCNRFHRVKVRIVKINEKSVIGEGLESRETPNGTYQKGFRYKVPRIEAIKEWTANNCVEHPDVTAFIEMREAVGKIA